MRELTRRRYPERSDCWHVYCGDVHVGKIARRVGILLGSIDCLRCLRANLAVYTQPCALLERLDGSIRSRAEMPVSA
jgi:hypothetical protein